MGLEERISLGCLRGTLRIQDNEMLLSQGGPLAHNIPSLSFSDSLACGFLFVCLRVCLYLPLCAKSTQSQGDSRSLSFRVRRQGRKGAIGMQVPRGCKREGRVWCQTEGNDGRQTGGDLIGLEQEGVSD